jgi:hypothetical protein
MTKNSSRISSVLGTWTSTIKMKASIGHYEMLTYFVVHLIPNPMRQYGCSLEQHNCSEIDNHVCQLSKNNKGHTTKQCKRMEDGMVDWSDVSAFLYFGAKVDAGIPFNKHVDHNTGGWVGPLDLVLAQDTKKSTEDAVVDRYVARYVTTPTTPYLQMPENCTLFNENAFEQFLGSTAVNETTHRQVHAEKNDPYEPYLKTCDHGDVKPVLPLYEFRFLQQPAGNSTSNQPEQESVQVKLKYKILSIPKKTDIMYKVFPTLQKRMHHRHGAFRISGPYCYGGDPHRGYTFDLDYDSNDANDNQYITLVHGCVDGLPCVPSAGEISATSNQFLHNTTKPSNTASVEVGQVAVLTLVVYLLTLALLVSVVCNCRQTRRLGKWKKKAFTRTHVHRSHGRGPNTIGSNVDQNYHGGDNDDEVNPFGDLARSLLVVNGDEYIQPHDNNLSQPLLSENQNKEDQEVVSDESGTSKDKEEEEEVEEGDNSGDGGAVTSEADSVPEIARV